MADAKQPANAATVAQTLVDCGRDDAAYRDVYLTAAAAFLSGACSAADYAGLRALEGQRDMALQQSRAAVLQLDWAKVDAAAAHAETAQQRLTAQADVLALGSEVYECPTLRLDAFSPGLGPLLERGVEAVQVRAGLLERLARLAQLDPPRAAFYAARRAYFDGLQVNEAGATEVAAGIDPAQLQHQALEAAQRGDTALLRGLAQALQRQSTTAATPAAASAPAAPALKTTRPVDLAAALPAGAADRGKALGLVEMLAKPMLDANAPLLDYIYTRAWQPALGGAEGEAGGALHLQRELTEAGVPADLAKHPIIPQFLRNTFVTSLGTRYLPVSGAEAVLIEDFAEDAEPPAGALLSALELKQRVGLARATIEAALRARGNAVLQDELGLDPVEFRLVCVPWDLYLRVGNALGWGQQQRWTHFDGYQVLRNRGLRALVGGDVRYGGLADLVSLSPTDAREGVLARFAVVRRARFITRW